MFFVACYEDTWTVHIPGIIIVEDNTGSRRGIVPRLPRVQGWFDPLYLLVALLVHQCSVSVTSPVLETA